jgi:formamidopyrimidine-DNA glycosylase
VPELPEVETVRRGLEQEVLGQTITNVFITQSKVLKGQSETVFRERTIDRRVARVGRRGKYLLLTLEKQTTSSLPHPSSLSNDSDNNTLLCIHLKMRGQIFVSLATSEKKPYHCLSLTLNSGQEIRYHDMWIWGEVRALTVQECEGIKALKEMGPEPLENADNAWGNAWKTGDLYAALRTRNGVIKTVLLDQTVIAGVGNIYADEALFHAKLHPETRASSLTREECDRLQESIRTILANATERGGTQSEEFVDTQGQLGRYIPEVYGRGGLTCPVCKTPLQRIKLGGRGTVFCPVCQPKN